MNRFLLLGRPGGAVILATVVCLGCTSTQTPPLTLNWAPPVAQASPPSTRHFDHVLTIVLENQDYDDVIKDPYLMGLAKQGASFTDFRGLFHPSYANYLAMVSGRLIKTSGDWQRKVDSPTIGDRLAAEGFTWKNYAEGYPGQPGHCFLARRKDRYARKHVPFVSFLPVQRENCDNVVPATQLTADLKARTFPTYAFYSPDLDNDGHDPVTDPARGLAKASAWLQKFLGNNTFPPRTLTVVTFDESKGSNPENKIYTVFLGDMVKPDPDGYPTNYNHFNVLRTIEDNFGLQPLAEGDRQARPITEVWK
jgi:acid phosphatase